MEVKIADSPKRVELNEVAAGTVIQYEGDYFLVTNVIEYDTEGIVIVKLSNGYSQSVHHETVVEIVEAITTIKN